MLAQILLVLSALFALAGTLWQCGLAVLNGIESMEGFIGDHNRLRREEARRVREEIPVWCLLRRRRALLDLSRELEIVLTDDEQRTSRAYDRQAWGWSFLVVGSMLAVVAGFVVPTS